ncbi:exonuclease domain-containing protein [Paenibacillus glycanilyticus]|uniref:3'-5' exonuclease n=1 Tax=Paenibacillus glycanilyticus TaxID=126569 RepID=UPI00204182D6|nr:3'-5' exonuclease [Paenibacillus glycanilyticus]MCM3629537.1 exonuclease domain-containing protein [Paenibacillus glycanilyticus]
MDYIILDIEFNGRKFASDLPMEVIEIGAVRLNAQLQQTDIFSSLIKPVYFSKLNSFIKKKTGIPQEEIDIAPRFTRVIDEFIKWLDRGEPFILLTWGGEDLKRIIYDTRMHKLDDAFWLSIDYLDLLKGYLRYKNITNDVSVEAALTELNLASSGTAHRALDDAIMTADVFRAVFDHLDFDTYKQKYKDLYTNAKERRLVKNAVRAMRAQKAGPTWELLVSKHLEGKVAMTDPRKEAELKEYFEAEAAKLPPRPVPPQTPAGN